MFSEWTGRIIAWLIVVLTVLVVYEVVMRRFFNIPTLWSFEINKQLYAFHFMLVAGYALLHNSHVTVDILYVKFSKRTRATIDLITYLIFFFPFLAIMLFYGIQFAANAWAIRETVWGVFAAPLYPVKTVIPVTAGLLLLQGIASFIRQLYIVFKGEELC